MQITKKQVQIFVPSLLAVSIGFYDNAHANTIRLPEKSPHGRQIVQITHIQGQQVTRQPTVIVAAPVNKSKTHANWKSWEKAHNPISPPTLAPVHYKQEQSPKQQTWADRQRAQAQQSPVSVRAVAPTPPRSTQTTVAQKQKLPEKRNYIQARQENPQFGAAKKTQTAYERLPSNQPTPPVNNNNAGGVVAQRVSYNQAAYHVQQQNAAMGYTGGYTEYTPQYKTTPAHTAPREITLSEYQAMQNRVLPQAAKLKEKPKPHTHSYNDGNKGSYLFMPVKYNRISSTYGMRYHPVDKVVKMHTGVDFSAPKNTPIHAAQGGIVTFAGWRGGYGRTVIVRHNNEFATLYGHAEKLMVSVNQVVQAGQVIATVGSTGKSTGNHLHFEVLRNNQHLNPRNFLVY